MRRTLIALGLLALLLVAAGVAMVLLGVGPLAPATAARSVVFVAISRSADEADAQEIEAIDLAAGTRELFSAGGRIAALAVSPDRRSLYVALADGKVAMLDATTGVSFASVDLGAGPALVSLTPTTDGRTLFALQVTTGASALVPIDLSSRKALDPIRFTLSAGPAMLVGRSVVVPLWDSRSTQLAYVDAASRAETSRIGLSRASIAAPSAFRRSDTVAGVVAFDSGGPGGLGMHVYLLDDPPHWRDLQLSAPFPQGPQARSNIGVQVAVATDGTIHACTAAGAAGRRYVIVAPLQATLAGTECGPLAGGDQILMAKRDPAQLLVLDPITGKTLRSLPLAGVPARLAR